jgi:lisH domain-containing protein FOPNL
MSNINELKNALKESLEEKGVLGNVRALLREAIYEVIETDEKPKPRLSDENLLINELILEYMKYFYFILFLYSIYFIFKMIYFSLLCLCLCL